MATFDFPDIDEVIHGRVRLAIMTYLISNNVADFNELKEALQATQGNLGAHLRKLEEAGYVKIEKGFVGRKPRTRALLTQAGREAFTAYLDEISRLVERSR